MSCGLIESGEERIAPKDFKSEVRGFLDVEHLLDNAIITLNEDDSSMESIIMNIVQKIALIPRLRLDEQVVRSELFSFDEHFGVRLKRKLQGYDTSSDGMRVMDGFVVAFGNIDGISHRLIGFSRLIEPTNLGHGMEEISLVILVLSPLKEKGTKSSLETARSFSSLLLNDFLRMELNHAVDESSFKEILHTQAIISCNSESSHHIEKFAKKPIDSSFRIGSGVYSDLIRRLSVYKSDWTDGVKDIPSISKSVSTVFFLLSTLLPTTIAYGMLDDDNTHGLVNVQKVILGQAIGGIFFSLFGGQPMLIISTSAPLSIIINVIFSISISTSWSFHSLYTLTGLWAMLFLFIASLLQAADFLKLTRRSTEEQFSLFIACALSYKAVLAMARSYNTSYAPCFINSTLPPLPSQNHAVLPHIPPPPPIIPQCHPESVLLFILLSLLTFWLSITLDSFRNTPFLSRVFRNLLSDYALPLSLLAVALVSHFLFFNVPKETFNIYSTPDMFIPFFWRVPLSAHVVCFFLAIPLSVLFFVDQLLVTKTVDNKQNKLRKGSAYHWDLFVVAILNVFLSLLNLPWMHGALPSSFLHLRSLADVEERISDGRLQQVIVNPRETRLSVLIAHIAMGVIYAVALPLISRFLPTSLFQGLFLFMAFSSLFVNQFWHRLLLLFTEQRQYPPTSYIRRVPQRIIHLFTFTQLIQLSILLLIGLSAKFYISMLFPLIIALFVPIRLFLLPRLFSSVHLESMDGCH